MKLCTIDKAPKVRNQVLLPNLNLTPIPNTSLNKKTSSPSKQLTKFLVDQFFKYIISADGGQKNEQASKQTASQIKRMYTVIKASSVSDMFQPRLLRDHFLTEYCKEMKYEADTVKRYLRSLGDFCDFVIAEEVEIPNCSLEKVSVMKMKLLAWSKTYKKQSKERFWERQEEDEIMMVTPQQISTYKGSEHSRAAIKLFGQYASPYCQNMINMTDFCIIRDFLFVELHTSTAQRSGVSANMKLKEFEAALQQDDGGYVIKVRDHKTFHVYGDAIVILERHVFDWLSLFFNKIRSQISVCCPYVFTSWSGKHMGSGAISRQLHSLWLKAGIYALTDKLPKNLSCTILRKSASTGIREAETGFYAESAAAMSHSIQTAETHYVNRKKLNQSKQGCKVVRGYFHGEVDSKYGATASPVLKYDAKRSWRTEEERILKSAFADKIVERNVKIEDVRQRYFSLNIKELNR
ncbi:uncharacterized protein LOC130648430 [Hydractinia symbiolongicarpus]|uniref:uncharacterized protein LOC130648430 n=1 Tax=Hydractinia symbiolongicarpus TaxID=13093 RepID=UPI00254D3E7B|nr:uncharacterized protein LOC130648430 [Hydractinia symbiolongicarpus]